MSSYLIESCIVCLNQFNYIFSLKVSMTVVKSVGNSWTNQQCHNGHQQKHHHLHDASSLADRLWRKLFQRSLWIDHSIVSLKLVLRSCLRTRDLYVLCPRLFATFFPSLQTHTQKKMQWVCSMCEIRFVWLSCGWWATSPKLSYISLNRIYRVDWHTGK